MSLNNTTAMIRSLRPYHLGFCFFWCTSLLLLAGLAPQETTWGLFQQAFQLLAVVILAALAVKDSGFLSSRLAPVATLLLIAGALLYALQARLGVGHTVLPPLAGLALGCGSGLFFTMWQEFYVTEGAGRAPIYITLSAVISAVLYLAVAALPPLFQDICSVVVFPLAAGFCLQMSLKEVIPYPARRLDQPTLRKTIGDLWKPVLCVSALGLEWRLMSNLFAGATHYNDAAILIGFGIAAAILSILELLSPRAFDILHVYQVLFPLITGVFIIAGILGQSYTSLLVGTLMFGFEITNLLLLVTCASYTSSHYLPPAALYALCIGPTLLFMLAGDLLGRILSPLAGQNFTLAIDLLLVSVYVLSVILLLVSRGRGTARTSEIDEMEAGTRTSALSEDDLLIARLQSMGEPDTLSPREAEIALLLLKGNTVPAISRKLFISENTIRGHTKSIYRKLDIHSRQELVDLFS